MTGWRKRQIGEHMTKDEALKLALEALEAYEIDSLYDIEDSVIAVIKEALAQPAPVQKPVVWNVIDPFGNIVATEKNAIRGWARVEGYKPTVEGLLGFHEKGWRVLPAAQPAPVQYPLPDDMYDSKDWRDADYAGRVEWLHTMYESSKRTLDAYTTPPQRTWIDLTEEDMPGDPNPMYDHKYFIAGMVYASFVLKEKNT